MASVLRQPLRAPASAAAQPFCAQLAQCGLQRTALAGRGGAFPPHHTAALLASIPRQLRQLPGHARRGYSSGRRGHGGRDNGEMAPSVSMAQMRELRPSAMISFRIPQTFVAPDMRQYLSRPSVFAQLYWRGVKARATDYLAELSLRLQSKPSFFTAARFKPNKKAIAPMAKDMHYRMLEATAAGDVPTLRRLLTSGHCDEVAGLIMRRARGQRCDWELLSYKGKPQLVSHKLMMVPGPAPMYLRQAVVAIRSRQRFTWTTDDAAASSSSSSSSSRGRRASRAKAAAPAPAPPSVVEKDVRENVVLVSVVDRNTWRTEDWRIFGFLPDTTVESWDRELDLMAKGDMNVLGGSRVQ